MLGPVGGGGGAIGLAAALCCICGAGGAIGFVMAPGIGGDGAHEAQTAAAAKTVTKRERIVFDGLNSQGNECIGGVL